MWGELPACPDVAASLAAYPTLKSNQFADRFAFFDGLNRFYVRREDRHLLEHFRIPLNICDQWDKPVVISFLFLRGAKCEPEFDALERARRRFAGRVNFIGVFFEREIDKLALPLFRSREREVQVREVHIARDVPGLIDAERFAGRFGSDITSLFGPRASRRPLGLRRLRRASD